ncbi:MAG TPA: vitamin K epoxide reductase family protein [Pyrinomonadaceae bacterium]|jgi:uncharacterized membrane protein
MEPDDSVASVEPRASGRRAAWFDALAAAVALVGLLDAIYLTVEHLAGRTVRCTVVAGCDKVLQSDYSSVGGIPLAALGALAYFAVFSLAILSAFGYTRLRVLLTILVALMFAASLWLLYLQAFVIRAFCQYCLLSAAVTTLLLILVVAGRLFRFK